MSYIYSACRIYKSVTIKYLVNHESVFGFLTAIAKKYFLIDNNINEGKNEKI